MGSPIIWNSKTTWTGIAAVTYGLLQVGLGIAHGQAPDNATILELTAGLLGIFGRGALGSKASTGVAPK